MTMETYQLLEKQFGNWVRASNTVACSSGSSALHIALEALQLPPGSEVLVPEYTMVACARAVTMAGLKPVFVDCNDSLLMDPEACIRQITPITRAIMPVHVYGRGCDMVDIGEISNRYDLAIIEDCAEYHGATLSGRADAYCWSFYSNKIVHGEEGGMIAFANPMHADRARMLRCQGFTARHDFQHIPRGINARLSNVNAALILNSLSDADLHLQQRAQIERWYNQDVPLAWQMPPRDVCWVYDVRIPNVDAFAVVQSLNRFGVSARVGFKPMSQQAEYLQAHAHLNAARLGRDILYLPVHPDMTEYRVREISHLLQIAAT
jgi:dTDP-4-amino-4,6-dideoxygalactose transaminase